MKPAPPARSVKKLSRHFEDPSEISCSNFTQSEGSFQKIPEFSRTNLEVQKIPHHPLSQAGSRTVEVVYVPPKALKTSSNNFSDQSQSRSRFDQDLMQNFDENFDENLFDPNFYKDPPIILSDDGQGTNFIDMTLPPPFEQPKLRDSWILPV